ncbi:MAG: tetratricopeptide repeat protein [Candidatus Kapabacteria bacterium]|nr:tetratricopeptide repeat protein [Candidatus Kapabacteria bacterium]
MEKKLPQTRTAVALIIAMLVGITTLVYVPVFDSGKEYTNWDDEIYVVDQPLVSSLSQETVAAMFDTNNGVAANYHPLTMLSLALVREVFGPSARAQAGMNVLLHLINTVLVFLLVLRLTEGKTVVGTLTALWFGIHPMHVESVAWISERKDVLYALFLLCSMLAYVRYINTNSLVILVLAFAAFVASCLSKAMAVPMVGAMVLLDYWFRRPISRTSILEKLPFALVAVWIGLTAIDQQQGAISSFETLTLVQRIVYAGYGFVMYWVKMLVPINLSAYYPYPATATSGALPMWYYAMPIVAAAMVVGPIVALRGREQVRRVFLFGMGFYALFVVLVLQLLSVGQVVMADRYSYVSYIGSLFVLASGLAWLLQRNRTVGLVLCTALSVLFCVQTFRQTRVWKNSETLWTNVIAIYPYEFSATGVRQAGVPAAYGARAMNYYRQGRIDRALEDLRVVARARAKGWKYYQLLGVIYGQLGEYGKAIAALDAAIAQQPSHASLYYNRAVAHLRVSMPQQALDDYRDALERNVDADQRYETIAGLARTNLMLGRFQESLSWSEQVIREYPNGFDGYFLRGTALVNLARSTEAIDPLRRSTTIRADDASAWFNLSIALRNGGQLAQAQSAADRARQLGMSVPP